MVTWLVYNSLYKREGTSRVLYKGNTGDNVTVPAPVTRDTTTLALSMLVRHGREGFMKLVA